MSYLLRHPGEVAFYTMQHVMLVGVALIIALGIALPLGILAARNKRIATPLLGFLGALYTIPSLAVLALLVHYVGLGFWTAIVMLAMYAQYILVRNIATGLREVPTAQRDAALGIGMTAAQRLWRVEFPQAVPVMLGGVRIAIVALIAIATLASYVNAGGLGVLIFDGLQRDYIEKTVAGSTPAVLLAIVADLLFRALEKRTSAGR
ncbi:MAG: ABC transporter permease [Candidatus Eremiobacteraeota bacterium]|nr:ABC transporter permease [Candidatus Eremiobacteraeota bacterium]